MNALMNPSAPLTMSSREIAELTGKRHDNVMRDIRIQLLMVHFYDDALAHLDADERLNAATSISRAERVLFTKIVVVPSASNLRTENFGFTLVQNGSFLTEILLDKDNALTLVSGYDVRARSGIIKRWQELESQVAKPAELSRMEILQIAMEAEKGRLLAIEQRDEAIRTKAEIGSRREATAMATASAKAREVARLKEELGRNQAHATVKVVEKMTRKAYDWRPLKKYCSDVGLQPRKVVDEQYGTVNAWPAIAWRNVHGVDLEMLFPSERDE